ncbi:MAG: amidophosphoribosyltransferase [Christensenellales bacterium]|jgi:amidophosphoribosyltransferase
MRLGECSELHEECAVFGLFNQDGLDGASMAYQALYSMQHRGQDGAGIAASTASKITYYKNLGLVGEVFSEDVLRSLGRQQIYVGHTRYATSTGSGLPMNTQPLVMHGRDGFLAMAHNGRIVNGALLREKLQNQGMLFQTDLDSEALMHLIARNPMDIVEGVREMMWQVQGSYALTLMAPNTLVGVRDPWGMRPLCIGKIGEGSYVLASESCGLDAIGATFLRDVDPGEIVLVDEQGIHSTRTPQKGAGSFCVFEYVYFARNDSRIGGLGVYDARRRMGELLSQVCPVEADLVAGVPDSALPAAMGYAEKSGIPYGLALIKNTYSGRTFIQEGQKKRERSVRMKLSPLKETVAGKRIVLVDDSIVRGTNSMHIVRMLRGAGAKEVHMRIASPPVQFPCHFGINTPNARRLVGARKNVEQLCSKIGADTLAYLGLEDLKKAVAEADTGVCCACFDGCYPMPIS